MPRPSKLHGREAELIELFRSGLSLREIARRLGVTQDTISRALNRLGVRRIVPDEEREAKLRGAFEAMRGTPDFDYALGICWGIGSVVGDKFVVRHKERDIPEAVQRGFALPTKTFEMSGSFRVAVPVSHPAVQYLKSLGWSGRWNHERGMPVGGTFSLYHFFRGYVRVHHSIGLIRRKAGLRERLRIFGAREIMEALARYLHDEVGVSERPPYPHAQSNAAWTLEYYLESEADAILRYFALRKE